MADRTFIQAEGSLEHRIVDNYCSILFGASGAVTSFDGKGIASVVKDGTGEYTITFTDRYPGFMGASFSFADSETAASWACIESQAVDSAAPSMSFRTNSGATGEKADPADGSTLYVQCKLKNSTL